MQSQSTVAAMEKRKHNRKSCTYLPVDFVLDNRLQRGLILNISESGACVENPAELSPGQSTTMTFLENHENGPVKTTGRVVRSFDNGFAVKFDVLNQRQQEAISTFVNRV